jgi:hypothetical protein
MRRAFARAHLLVLETPSHIILVKESLQGNAPSATKTPPAYTFFTTSFLHTTINIEHRSSPIEEILDFLFIMTLNMWERKYEEGSWESRAFGDQFNQAMNIDEDLILAI